MNVHKQRMTKAMLISIAFSAIATAGAGTAAAASTADAVVSTNSMAVQLERHQPSPHGIPITGSLTAGASQKGEGVSPAGYAMYNGEVNAYNVRLRTAPRIPSGILGYYNRQMQLTIQCWAPRSSGEDWYRVQIAQTGNDGPVGFMARRFINQWVAGPFPRCAGY